MIYEREGTVASPGAGPNTDVETVASEPTDAARKRAAVELIRSQDPALRSTARRFSICSEDADDAYQRGIEILLSKAPVTDQRQLLPWARTVIKHEALAIRKSRERVLNRPAVPAREEESDDWVELIPWRGDGPDEHAVNRERVARSREALALLKPHELKALTQLAEGYSYAEIASLNEWTHTKVNRCLAEGRARFRSVFRESEAGERCAKLEPLISACCDGELDGTELENLRNHLDACGACRATLRAYRAAPRAAAALAPLPVAAADPSLWEKLQQTVLSAQLRLQGLGGRDPDGTLGAVAATGGTRGAGAAALAKLATICLGTAGGAAACVAVGVLPAPDLGGRSERPPVIERPATAEGEGPSPKMVGSVSEVTPPTDPPNGDAATPSGNADPPPAPDPVAATPTAPAAPTPPPTPVESEFTAEAAGTPVASPPPAPAPAPAPAASAGSSPGGGVSQSSTVPLGGGGGEFAP
jgi:RNA polymerase sigma factor (sigma-70 family)